MVNQTSSHETNEGKYTEGESLALVICLVTIIIGIISGYFWGDQMMMGLATIAFFVMLFTIFGGIRWLSNKL